MLIRFVIENSFSFGERKEFSMIPNKKLKTLTHHKYSEGNFEMLKIASIYGANGSGKSNLIKSLKLLQQQVVGEIDHSLENTRFKFNDETESKDQIFAIDFIQDSVPFYYAIILNDSRIAVEELYISSLGRGKDELIYERKTDSNNNTEITFLEEFENNEKNQLLKSVLLDFVKPEEPIMKLLSNRDNSFFAKVKLAYKWFEKTLQVLTPSSRVSALAHIVDIDSEFKNYAQDLMSSFNLGITELVSEKKGIKDFFGEDDKEELNALIRKLKDSPDQAVNLRHKNNKDEIILVNENDTIWVKSLKIGHVGKNNKSALFDLREESDGTVRLLDFVPAFKSILSSKKVFVIDEIERSIHPLLIKELVEKFSLDEQTKGQLIFTTHESNLLDQNIFRQDEIWFTEKNKAGSTDLYSLNDFKEHKTIDIQKGYLNGRYGSIPFLGNLQDLNWHNYDTTS